MFRSEVVSCYKWYALRFSVDDFLDDFLSRYAVDPLSLMRAKYEWITQHNERECFLEIKESIRPRSDVWSSPELSLIVVIPDDSMAVYYRLRFID